MSSSPFSHIDLKAILQSRFGLPAFRGLQETVVQSVLRGQDVLALMPTGAGKSLCYQLPALVFPGVTVVISPLIALMRDQLRRLKDLQIPAIAVFSSEGNRFSDPAAMRSLRSGQIKVVLTSPERFQIQSFLESLSQYLPSAGVSLVVIDEAHCISEWGKTFRPAYLALGRLRDYFPHTPVLAMTASADQSTCSDILHVLRIKKECIIRGSFNRPELFYRVACSHSPWRNAIAYLQRYHAYSPAIFYCAMREETERLSHLLSCYGIGSRAYHAGLNADKRLEAEHWFQETQNGVMAATIAFGMGVDKPNIRLVAHVGGQHKVSTYYQETGRAGRDGVPSDVLLMLNPREYVQIRDSLLRDPTPVFDTSDPDRQSESHFRSYIVKKNCRRVSLLAGLDEMYEGPCEACDVCDPNTRPLPLLHEHSSMWVRKKIC